MTTDNILLKSYKNNDYRVFLCKDGTKIRKGNSFNPIFPESIDLKITDYCDLGCPFCHEKSTKIGKHGNIKTIFSKLENLPEGVELAIGGGNPLDHPEIIELLTGLKEMGFIVNMTINSEHLIQEKYIDILDLILFNDLIHGVGVSGDTKHVYLDLPNVVNHFIIGVQSLEEFKALKSMYSKILLLGYKTYGRGEKYFKSKQGKDISDNINQFVDYFSNTDSKDYPFDIVSFDNLAIKQLDLENSIDDFDSFFMGEDGEFTMYYDGVTNTYARSSTNKRIKFDNEEVKIIDVFKTY